MFAFCVSQFNDLIGASGIDSSNNTKVTMVRNYIAQAAHFQLDHVLLAFGMLLSRYTSKSKGHPPMMMGVISTEDPLTIDSVGRFGCFLLSTVQDEIQLGDNSDQKTVARWVFIFICNHIIYQVVLNSLSGYRSKLDEDVSVAITILTSTLKVTLFKKNFNQTENFILLQFVQWLFLAFQPELMLKLNRQSNLWVIVMKSRFSIYSKLNIW